MRLFYGGRELRHSQGVAATSVSCSTLQGIQHSEHSELCGFAIDMARNIVPWAVQRLPGKVLWLLSEHHGLALVQRWLEDCPEGRPFKDKVRVWAYKNEDRAGLLKKVKNFLDETFNADNVQETSAS